ncbi:uncharacterized protein RHO25_011456 [Cercospora beticola]|uniref:SMP domain-containing protein n=1 Tax=Cercospora beticola TaxID=122368 RepID=A0ABZ0P517_CERBT|nr:hypothetical protein RHO25_011456 [Cercospora beticola]
MVGSKTPGGQAAGEKFQKQQAEKEGLGAPSAPGKSSGTGIAENPGYAPVASDSGSTNVGVEAGTDTKGEKGISGVPVGPSDGINSGNMSGGGTSAGK